MATRITRSQVQAPFAGDENAAPKQHFRYTKARSGTGGGLSKPGLSTTALNSRKSVRPALGDISNRIQKTQDDQQVKKKRVLGSNPELLKADVAEPLIQKPQLKSHEDVTMKAEEDHISPLEESVADLCLSSIDQADANDPQCAAEYVKDIMAHLKKTEGLRAPSPNYMSKQTDINAKMREILIDWLVEVHLKFKLRDETLHLTINIIDRFLERRAVSRTKLQLVGCTAMLIASKYEEIYAPEVRDFVYISDKAYTRDQILAMESIVLNTLGFHLTVPTPFRFAERYIKVCRANTETKHRINYLTELCMQDYSFLKYLPSEIAASATFLAVKANGMPWGNTLQQYTGYDENALRSCASDLYALAMKEPVKYKAVRKKYLNKKFLEVSGLSLVNPFP